MFSLSKAPPNLGELEHGIGLRSHHLQIDIEGKSCGSATSSAQKSLLTRARPNQLLNWEF